MAIKKNNHLVYKGLIQAFGVLGYCGVIGIIFWKGNDIFGKAPNYFGPVTFLLLFSVSVLVCALIVFYHPYKLFFDGKKKEALDLVLFTTLWLFMFFLIFIILAALF